ncbi:MAG: hypothetical protein QXF75_00095 [Candidatus Bathyarchaeia archaeon]
MEEIRRLEAEKRKRLEELFQKRQVELQRQFASIESELSKRQAKIEELQRELEKLQFKDVDLTVLKLFLEKSLGFNYEAELKEWRSAVDKLKSEMEALNKEVEDFAAKARKIREKLEFYNKNIVFHCEGLIDFDGPEVKIQCPNCQKIFTCDMRQFGGVQNILSCRTMSELQYVYAFIKDGFNVQCSCGYSVKVYAERYKI